MRVREERIRKREGQKKREDREEQTGERKWREKDREN